MRGRSRKKKKIDIIDIIMLSVIVILGIFIIFQGLKLIKVSGNGKKDTTANIVIPVLSDNTNSSIRISANEFKVGDRYVFKVTNFRLNDISKKNIYYNVNITNNNQADISVFKNNSDKDLATGEKEFSITKNKLKGKQKQTDIYSIKLNSDKNLKDNSMISINIES